MTTVEIVGLVLGSAVLAALISGVFSKSTTSALIKDQRDERREGAERAKQAAEDEERRQATAQFRDHFVSGGLEHVALELDRASHELDLRYRRARRLRAIVRDLPDGAMDQGSFRDLIEVHGLLDPPSTNAIHIAQSSLLPFPGSFMQGGLLLNRCIALADDFLQRYPWTKDDRLPAVDRYLSGAKTTLAASARRFEAAAVVVRQLPPQRYDQWSATTLADPRLTELGDQLTAMVDDLLRRDGEGADTTENAP